jgi:biopolymer transport protein ExbB
LVGGKLMHLPYLLHNGGPMVWPLLVLSIASLAIVLERSIVIGLNGLKGDKAKRKKIMDLIREGKTTTAIDEGKSSPDFIIEAIVSGLELSKESPEKAFEVTGTKALSRFTNRLSFLDITATLAPSLGLLGTVIGLIKVFGFANGTPLETPLMMSGGISQALISTGFGLFLSVLCTCFHYIFSQCAEKARQELINYCTQAELLVSESSN